MIYWIILAMWIMVGIYDLYRYFKTPLTITQQIHKFIEDRKIPMWLRLTVTIACLAFSWYLGGVQLFVPVLTGWVLCHLIGWDF